MSLCHRPAEWRHRWSAHWRHEKVSKSGSRTGSRLGDFCPFRNRLFGCLRQGPGCTVTFPFEDKPVGAVAEPIDGGHAQHPVGREDVSPFAEVQIARDHGSRLLVTSADEVVDVLIVGRPQGLEAKIVDDEQGDLGQLAEDPLVGAGGPRAMKASGEGTLTQEADIHSLTDGTMAQRLGQMALAGTAGTDDEDRGLFPQVASRGQVVDQASVQVRQTIEGEVFEGLVVPELRLAQEGVEALLVPPGDLILEQEREELGIGQLPVDGLAVARLQAFQDAGQTEGAKRGL